MKASWLVFVATILIVTTGVFSLYEDQIGKFDWRLQFIGKPLHVVIGPSGDKDGQPSRVYVTTEQNVLASLNWQTGEIIWRHVFEQTNVGTVNGLLISQGDVITLTGGGQYLMGWERHRGTLRWSAVVSTGYCEETKMAEIKGGSTVVLSPCANSLMAFDRMGNTMWTLPLNKDSTIENVQWLQVVSTAGEIVVLGENTSKSQLIVLLVTSTGSISKTLTRDLKYDQNKVAILSHPDRLVWIDTENGAVSSLGLSTGSTNDPFRITVSGAKNPASLKLKIYMNRYWTVVDDTNVWLPTSEQGKEEFRLERLEGMSVGFTSNQENVVYSSVAAVSARGGFSIRFYDTKWAKQVTDWDIVVPTNEAISSPVQIYPVVPAKNDRSRSGVSVVVCGNDHSISLVNPPGKIAWSRQEALALVLSVEMLDLPLSEAQANIEEEFSNNGTVLSMFTRRVTSQAIQLQRLLLGAVNEMFSLADLLGKSGESFLAPLAATRAGHSGEQTGEKKSQRLERDYFNLHKLIVVTTTAGKLFGLDSATGAIVWQKFLPDISPLTTLQGQVMPLYVLRTTAHFPHPARCAVIGKQKTDGRGALVTFNPITGTDFESLALHSNVKQVFVLPVVDDNELQGVGIVTGDMKVQVYPSSVASEFSDGLQRKPFIVFLTDGSGGLNGYKVAGLSQKNNVQQQAFAIFDLEAAWWKTMVPAEQQGKLIAVATKRFAEMVHSHGRVLGDRSVLYKYINPNLAAVMTESVDSTGKNQMTVHLVDVVTGDIVFSAVHRRVGAPYHLLHCENWIVYAYWNEKSRRNEIAVLELFEGKEQADPAKFSSFNPPPSPIVMRQAYVFPQGVSAMAVTDTEKGITARHLLIAMPFGGILELSKAFLDPRRVLSPTMEQREEGLYPYMPDLPIMTEQIINYNQSLYNVRAIHTAPSGLESTSLILAYGLDLYFTRVTPSGTFDILKDDFDHWLIGCVLLGLFIGSIIAKKLARHRDVKLAWK